jgi:ribokinase
MKRPRITVVGSVNADMVVTAARLPAAGETVVGDRFLMAAGGKGANQAVAAARLGTEVTLVAKVGRDAFGETAIANLRREGIDTDFIVIDDASATGVALITVDQRGENQIAVASGANHKLSPSDIDRSADTIRKSDVLLVQLEVPLESVARAIEIASGAGVLVILNPAPAMPLPKGLLAKVDYLTPNEAEAAQITDIAIEDEPSARVAASQLLAAGPRNVIITLGAVGALFATPARTLLLPSPTVAAVDSTAAGDAFNGALAWAFSIGRSGVDPVRVACFAGALSTTTSGAQPSLPTLDELRSFIAKSRPNLII